jgi:hypothetical protein
VPILSQSVSYDRGVGFFSSGWLRANSEGMLAFAENGGRARWVTSPILSAEDWSALLAGDEARREPALKAAIQNNICDLRSALEHDTRNALAWMVADGILEFRLAVPIGDLDGGEFHDKFGVFTDAAGDCISFNGSYNDSLQGLRNYESLKVFSSWDTATAAWVQADQRRFERLWSNKDPNVRVYRLPDAAKEEILKLRTSSRPYGTRCEGEAAPRFPLWPHQELALDEFLTKRRGVVEMATGTGKTRLSLAIADKLISDGSVSSIIVAADGTDLLDQWYLSILDLVRDRPRRWAVFRQYDEHREGARFRLDPERSIFLCSRYFLPQTLTRLEQDLASKVLLIHDEVHRLGSPSNRQSLAGLSGSIPYRLGLSATPEREYDAEGNVFIENEIGPVIFRYGLEEAIEDRILSPPKCRPRVVALLPTGGAWRAGSKTWHADRHPENLELARQRQDCHASRRVAGQSCSGSTQCTDNIRISASGKRVFWPRDSNSARLGGLASLQKGQVFSLR